MNKRAWIKTAFNFLVTAFKLCHSDNKLNVGSLEFAEEIEWMEISIKYTEVPNTKLYVCAVWNTISDAKHTICQFVVNTCEIASVGYK